MTRILAILLLAIVGLPGMGVGIGQGAPGGDPCGPASCHQVVLETSCCGETTEVEYCPKSDGPCACAVAPMPERQPRPDSPYSRTDRDQLTAVTAAPTRVVTLTEPAAERPPVSAQALGLLAGLTHNQIQASLGLWTT